MMISKILFGLITVCFAIILAKKVNFPKAICWIFLIVAIINAIAMCYYIFKENYVLVFNYLLGLIVFGIIGLYTLFIKM